MEQKKQVAGLQTEQVDVPVLCANICPALGRVASESCDGPEFFTNHLGHEKVRCPVSNTETDL